LINYKKVTEEFLPCNLLSSIAVPKSAGLRSQFVVTGRYQTGSQVAVTKAYTANDFLSEVAK